MTEIAPQLSHTLETACISLLLDQNMRADDKESYEYSNKPMERKLFYPKFIKLANYFSIMQNTATIPAWPNDSSVKAVGCGQHLRKPVSQYVQLNTPTP